MTDAGVQLVTLFDKTSPTSAVTLTNGSPKLTDGSLKSTRGFTEMRGKLDAAAAAQQQIVDLLQTFASQQPAEPTD